MSDEFQLDDERSETQRLLDFFSENGAMSHRDWALKAMAAGVFNESTIEAAKLGGLIQIVKTVERSTKSTTTGLTEMAVCEPGSQPRVKYYTDMSQSEMEWRVEMMVKKGSETLERASLVREMCIDQHGSCSVEVPV